MTSSHLGPGPGPGTALRQLSGSLALWALALILGAVLGGTAARAIRAAGLHWSWPALVAGAALLARGGLGGLAPVVAVTGMRAAVLGRRWQREDLGAGAEAARRARARATPVDAAFGLARSALDRAGLSGRSAAATLRAGRLAIGRDERGRLVDIALCGAPAGATAHGRGRHTLVVGATGSGKTVTQSVIARAAIAHGFAAIVVDPKGDARLRSVVRDAAIEARRPLLAWSPRGDAVYNPFARGSETEVADKVLAGETFTEPHYLRQAQRYLGHAVRALRAGGCEVSLRRIVEVLDPTCLEQLSRDLEPEAAEPVQGYLDSLTPRQHGDLTGVRDRLAILAESDVAAWLDPGRTVGAPVFDLLGTARSGGVAYFDLEADTRPLLMQMLGAAIVQDLLTAVSALQAQPAPTLVLLDEFSAIASAHVVRLFARARSAGFSLLLGTQELSDLRLPGREHLLEQVTGNLATLVAHRQVVPRSAELVASLAGTDEAWRLSRRGDGRSSRTRVREGVLDPTRVMRLADGQAAVIGLDGGGRVQLARIFAPTDNE